MIGSPRLRLVLTSFQLLLVELALIRWLGSNVLHLSYFSNIVLLASFLGMGLGFLRTNSENAARYPRYPYPLLAALIVVVLLVPVGVNREDSDLIFFTAIETTGPPPWLVLPVLFATVTAIMCGLGRLMAQCFLQLPRLDAYRYDLLGSLLGIATFTLFSFLGAPPIIWGVTAVAVALVVYRPQATILVGLSGIIIVLMLGIETRSPNTVWSPYYKIEAQPAAIDGLPATTVIANGVPHQAVWDATEKAAREPFYTLPYQRSTRSEPGNTLIIGAGTGTDVALALQEGATHIDAVEIDPEIRNIGVTKNPNRPFDSDLVDVHITDGREFLQRTDNTYDTVILALPDSLTLVAGASQLRLESYLFTEDAMQRVYDVLRDDGVFAMYNYYRDPWLVGRLAATMQAAFGHEPCVDLDDAQVSASLLIAKDPVMQQCEGAPATAALLAAAPDPATDNWPFLYLKNPSIPGIYVTVLVKILLFSAVSVVVAGRGLRGGSAYVDLFLLGAAFLLVETRAVTMFALLFGTTWLVNAIVFGGILCAVLLAVEFTRRFGDRIRLPIAYGVLFGSLAVAWFVSPAGLLSLPVPIRLLAAVALTFAPVFTANVIFAARFSESSNPTLAFGVNLLGAMVGGCLEYLALITGYQALLIVAALLYAGAWFFGRVPARDDEVPRLALLRRRIMDS